MANKRIAGIIVEIGGDTTKLGRALEDVDKRSSELSKELGEVNKLLKLDPGNTELIAQKQKILAEQIDNTAKRLEILRDAEDQVTAAFERGEASEEELRAIQREVIATEQKLGGYEKAAKETAEAEEKIGDAAEESAEDLEKQEDAAEDAKEELKALAEKGADKAAKCIIALGAAVGATVTAIGKLVFDAAEAADELGDMSKKTGLSTEQLQIYRYTADMCGTSLETVTGAQAKLVKSMSSAKKGTGETAAAFERLGVKVRDDVTGEMRSADDVFMDVIDALGEIPNETERDTYAMQIFGKSAQDLNGLILEGADGLREYSNEAKELGVILSDDAIDTLGEVQTELKKVRAQFDTTKKNVAAKFAPAVTRVLTAIGKLLKKGGDMINDPRIEKAIDKLVRAFEKFIDKALDKALDLIPKVVNVLGFLIENFDKLAIALGAVWLVCKGVSVVTGVITAIKSVKSAIEAAETAIGASATATMGWIGVIGAAVAALIALCGTIAKKHKEHMEEITATSTEVETKLKEVADSMKSAKEEYEHSIGTSSAAADMAEKYLERLEELESQGEMTADEQREYNELVAKLKAVMPDLNVELDENTGLLKDGAAALMEQVKNWKAKIKLEAIEERLRKTYEAQVDLQLAMNKAQDDLIGKQELYNKLWEAKQYTDNEGMYRYLDLLREAKEVYGASGFDEFEKVFRKAYVAANDATAAYTANVTEAEELVDVYTEASAEVEAMASATDTASDAIDGLGDSLEETGEEADEFAAEHTQKVIGAVQDMFNKIETKTDLTMGKITKTLKHNFEALQQYEENMQIIAERGASESVMTYLEGLGIEQAGVIDMIAHSTDKEFKAFVDQFDKNTDGAYAAGKKWGKQAGAGIVDGMDSKESSIKKSGKKAARALAKAFTDILEIKSPSRLFKRYARFTGQGYIDEFENITPDMAEASANAAEAVSNAFHPKTSFLDRALQGRSAATEAAQTSGVSNLMNKLDTIIRAVEEGQMIMLDGETLVGATAERMDSALGGRAILAGRRAFA